MSEESTQANVIFREVTPKDKNVSPLFGKRTLSTLFNRLKIKRNASVDISAPHPSYRVVCLGSAVTGFAKGEECIEKPLNNLWKNYTQSCRPDVFVQLTICGGRLKITSSNQGLTEYWANRITFCASPNNYPRLFCWVYRHEGKRLRHELRCHAVLCSSASIAKQIDYQLRTNLIQALVEFKKDKISRQNARLSLVNSVYENPSRPRRKMMLCSNSSTYRPPLERSKSAPKLTIIEENLREEEEDNNDERVSNNVTDNIGLVNYFDNSSLFVLKTQALKQKLAETSGFKQKNKLQPKTSLNTFTNSIVNNYNIQKSTFDDCTTDDIQFAEKDAEMDFSWLEYEPHDLQQVNKYSSLGSNKLSDASKDSCSEPPSSLGKQQTETNVNDVVLSEVKNVELLENCSDFSKYYYLKQNVQIPDRFCFSAEVSLIPYNEEKNNFISLDVYEKETRKINTNSINVKSNSSEVQQNGTCNKESGYSTLTDHTKTETQTISRVSEVVIV